MIEDITAKLNKILREDGWANKRAVLEDIAGEPLVPDAQGVAYVGKTVVVRYDSNSGKYLLEKVPEANKR